MKSKRTKQFRRQLDALPADVQRAAEEAYQLFQENPWNPVLHLGQVHGKRGLYWSARVQGLKYRALAIRQGPDTWLWFWIGPHAEYDKLLQ